MPTIENLKELNASGSAISSPNINWKNGSNIAAFKRPFSMAFWQVHLSHSFSDLGHHDTYQDYRNLTGGSAIITCNHCSSRVSASFSDPRWQGSYSSITIQGTQGSKLTIICAYIAVPKGTDFSKTSFYSQQIYVMELEQLRCKRFQSSRKCPQKAEFQELVRYITQVKTENHAIILTIDASQTARSCHTKKRCKTAHHQMAMDTNRYGWPIPVLDGIQT